MNSLIPANFGAVSSIFADQTTTDDLSSGIQSSFGMVGYKGKVWSIRHRGAEQQLMRDDGDGARGNIEVVIVKASQHVSKIWYEQGYVEGSNAAPDCFSNNGITPDPTSAKRQCESCAVCPHNQWGSRITPAGKNGKSCSDSKRIAVVPMGDIANEAYGGPMLLRVPAASLQDLAAYGQKMQQMGYPYFSIATKIAFDPAESFPKFVFSALRPLNDAEGKMVIEHREGHTTQRILSENEFATAAATQQAQADQPLFEMAPDVGAATQQAAPQQAATQQASVGDQARAAAAANAAANPPKKTAPAVKPVAEVEPSSVGTVEQPQVASTPDEPVESDEDRELREMEELLHKRKAAAAAKAAAAKVQPKTIEAQAVTTEVTEKPAPSGFGNTQPAATQQTAAQPSAEQADSSMNMASDFEANLDDMLANLLP